jgi:N-acetylmuramoyl-L-alanine amidase
MRIIVSSGHGAKVAGAGGIIQEVAEARRVTAEVVKQLRALKATVTEFHENNATTQSQNVSNIIAFHNGRAATTDLNVSVHFNHSGGATVDRGIGTETLFFSQQALAARVSKAIADVSGLINRGAKKRTDLSFLARTQKPSILLEICFVNSREDCRLYLAHFSAICLATARSILNQPVSATPIPQPTQQVCPTCKRPL